MASTTMKRIAAELGVSVTTVSKVLNQQPDIGPATRARVLAKVEELGFRNFWLHAKPIAAAIQDLREETGIAWVQLHGDEPPETVRQLMPEVFKAVRIGDADDVRRARLYPGPSILVDAKVDGTSGGAGIRSPHTSRGSPRDALALALVSHD